MPFNFKAFATGFMDDQAKAINARLEKAEDYEQELKDNADAGKSRIGKMRLLKDLGKAEIARLINYGAKPKHINAAIASGPDGLFTFSKNLTAEAQKRDVATFSPYEIDALVDMPEAFQYTEMDPNEFYDRSHSLSKPSLGSTKAPKRGGIKRALGLGLSDVVRSDLDREAYSDGFSVMDINELSRQEAYESLSPGTFFTFNPTEKYDSMNTQLDLNKLFEDAGDIPKTRLFNIRKAVEADASIPKGLKEKEITERKNTYVKQRRLSIAISFADKGGKRFLEDPALELRDRLGDKHYNLLKVHVLNEAEVEKVFVDALLALEGPGIKMGNTVKIGAVNNNGETKEYVFTLDADGQIASGKENGEVMLQHDMEMAILNLQDNGYLQGASVVNGVEDQPTIDEEPEVTELAPVEPRPKPTRGNSQDRENWDTDHGETHNPNGSVKKEGWVEPKPIVSGNWRTKASEEYDEQMWIIDHGETNNPNGSPKTETPDVEVIEETPDVEVIEEAQDTETKGKTIANPITFEGIPDDEKQAAYDALPIGTYFIHPNTDPPETLRKE